VIGVISHMEELAERLPDRIEVVKQGNTSTVRG
jgi:DNA repair exonuclease SbcCD ATPase subunit